MKLDRKQFVQLHRALLDGYDRNGLRQIARFGLAKSLSDISTANTDSDVIFDLIEWAEKTDNIKNLVDAAVENNSQNAQLKQLLLDSQDWLHPVSSSSDNAIAVATPKSPISFSWITIPAGSFLMGSKSISEYFVSDRVKDELPQHTLYLSAFRISMYPITNQDYFEFVRSTGYKMPEHWQGDRIPKGKDKHPVVYVSWHDALTFCQWTSVRLPSEAEWEKAARGADGREYPWGSGISHDYLNYNMRFGKFGETTPVDRYRKGASPYSVMDMVGNVWEWTCSLYRPYPYMTQDGREDSTAVGERSVRGGFFGTSDGGARCAYRWRENPGTRDEAIGFRVAALE